MSLPWQIIADCPHCHTRGGILALMDPAHPACHLGLAAQAECRMCGYREDPGEPDFVPRDPFESRRCPSCRKPLQSSDRESHLCPHCDYTVSLTTTPGIDCTDSAAVTEGLTRWAASEGLSVEELCEGSLGGSLESVLARYAAGEVVESTLDAIAFLFPGVAAGSAMGVAQEAEAPVTTAPEERRQVDARAPARLMVSVMVADGQIRSGERAFVDAFLTREGLEPLTPPDLRPWRPHEVGPIESHELAERTVHAAVELMHLDGERDGSELRIVRTFARAWGVSEASLEDWNRTYDRRYAPPMSVVWRALSRWVRTR